MCVLSQVVEDLEERCEIPGVDGGAVVDVGSGVASVRCRVFDTRTSTSRTKTEVLDEGAFCD